MPTFAWFVTASFGPFLKSGPKSYRELQWNYLMKPASAVWHLSTFYTSSIKHTSVHHHGGKAAYKHVCHVGVYLTPRNELGRNLFCPFCICCRPQLGFPVCVQIAVLPPRVCFPFDLLCLHSVVLLFSFQGQTNFTSWKDSHIMNQ